jgi:hypothetical protein
VTATKDDDPGAGEVIRPARVGDVYRFTYPDEPQYNCNLIVVRVLGDGPDDLVFFDDHSHTKQKHIPKVEKLA